jgi:hypothetical protein
MIEVAEAIKSFLPEEQQKADPVPPSEEPVFALTASQLQGLITQRIAAYYIHNAEEITELVYSAMETFDRAVLLLPAVGRTHLRSSLQEALLKDGRDPYHGIKIIEAHTKAAIALSEEGLL